LLQKILFKDKLARKHIENEEYADAMKVLLRHQRLDWDLLRDSYEALNNQRIREFEFDGFTIKAQYNPGRIYSTSAKVDEESINKRKCFLCNENRPAEQKAIQYKKDFLIICNPHPIFPEHFTIPLNKHFPQRVNNYFSTMLSLSKDLSKYYSIIYNGPKCGASAPDHFHFQAGTKYFLPIEEDIKKIKTEYGVTLSEDFAFSVTAIDDGLRKFIFFEGKKEREVLLALESLYKIFELITKPGDEPMFNILSVYREKKGWEVFVFPRSKHRPSLYYLEEKEKILLSPGTIDLSGVCVVPIEKHFEKLNREHLVKIFKEVCVGKEEFEFLKSSLERRLND
jgi:Domain of unknown function (DUF4922)